VARSPRRSSLRLGGRLKRTLSPMTAASKKSAHDLIPVTADSRWRLDCLAEGGGIRTSASRNQICCTLSRLNGIEASIGRAFNSRCACSSPAPRAESRGKFRFHMQRFESRRPSQPVLLHRVLKRTSREMPPRGGISHIRAGLGVRKLAAEAGFRRPVSNGDILVSRFLGRSREVSIEAALGYRPPVRRHRYAMLQRNLLYTIRLSRSTMAPHESRPIM
jgi:hypothetical protein